MVALIVFMATILLSFAQEVVHPPFQTGDCSICHVKTQDGYSEALTMKVPDLCYTCHTRKDQKKIVHNPVKAGNCTLCHDPHKSKTQALLKAPSQNDLCVSCHPSIKKLLSKSKVHPPVELMSCSACHDPHSEDHEFRLKMPRKEICFMCHPDIKEHAEKSKNKHTAVFMRDGCLNCHNPHGADHPKLIHTAVPKDLCLSCHDKIMGREEDGDIIKNMAEHFALNPNPHGPNQWGDCVACHNPHGSDNYRILKAPFPSGHYAQFSQENYICFMCHDPTPFLEKETEASGFRNGKLSLHWVHVNKDKGIVCGACHDWHASSGNPHHIKDYTEFGKVKFPLNYVPTENGGFCGPLCHPRRGYDRVKPVVNPR